MQWSLTREQTSSKLIYFFSQVNGQISGNSKLRVSCLTVPEIKFHQTDMHVIDTCKI